ncbi:hypothetical protein CHUAL_002637 [Chamberlinius hualienensis]
MSPKYKLTYFNGRGLAELSRLVLAQAGVEYEDVRLEKDNWPEIKPTTPLGQVPILEVDGQVIFQSRAIARFLAREHGLAGSNSIEAARIDGLVDAVYDLWDHGYKIKFEQDAAKKEELTKKFLGETLPPYLSNITKILTNNGGKFLVGDKLSWADIAVAYALSGLREKFESSLESHDTLKQFSETVLNLPNIKAWIDKRPVTDF